MKPDEPTLSLGVNHVILLRYGKYLPHTYLPDIFLPPHTYQYIEVGTYMRLIDVYLRRSNPIMPTVAVSRNLPLKFIM